MIKKKQLKAELIIDDFTNFKGVNYYWILTIKNRQLDDYNHARDLQSIKKFKTEEEAKRAGEEFANEYGIKII